MENGMSSEFWALVTSGVLVTVVTGVGILIWKHVDNAAGNAIKALEGLHLMQISGLEYQTHVAETYARLSGVERMESGVFAVLNRLEAKVDKLQERGVAHG